MKLNRCGHIDIVRDKHGKLVTPTSMNQCDKLTSKKGVTVDGRKIPVCAGHAALYEESKK